MSNTEPTQQPAEMGRILTGHRVNGLNEAIAIFALGEPGKGGANDRYFIELFAIDNHPSKTLAVLQFQNKPIAGPQDFNGITNEALLEVVIDRMRGFQHLRKENGEFDYATRGEFACKENACALTHLEEAQMWLQKRTLDRMKRGVEGSYQK